MPDPRKPFPDPLVRDRLFPEAAQIFEFAPVSLADALDNGIVAVDTNVLLVPYTTGQASLEQIRRTYERLTTEGRLRIPGQVAREFAELRAEKLKILFQQLSRRRDISVSRSDYPFLEGIPAYVDAVKREEEIDAAIANYRKVIGELLSIIEAWHWDDPVSQIYRGLFKAPIIVEPPFDREKLLEELKYRQEHRVPPGYKDAENEHSGIGDLLIWKTILKVGEQEQRHLIFVSGDEKSDWRYRSESTALYPRFELLDEYRRFSGGNSLLIISFADLLQYFGATPTVVAEVKQGEAVSALVETRPSALRNRMGPEKVEQAVLRWLHKRFPDSQIDANYFGYPDFIVRSATGFQGFEVTYIRGVEESTRRISRAMHRIREFSASPEIPVTLVLVTLSHHLHNLARRLLARLPNDRYYGVPIVVGTIDPSGQFEEYFKIDPNGLEQGLNGE